MIKKILNKYEGFTKRERTLVNFFILAFVVVIGLELFIWSSLSSFKKENEILLYNKQRLIDTNKELLRLSVLHNEKSPIAMEIKKNKIKAEIKNIITNKVDLYIQPEDMVAVLNKIFNKSGVSLIKMENEVSALNENKDNSMPIIYKHIFNIKVSGDFNSILQFIKRFQDVGFIGIESFDFVSLEYPINELSFKIYILNDSKDLIKI